MTLAEVLHLLACPHCGRQLAWSQDHRSVGCATGHFFDVARQGYLNLLGSRQPRNADTTAMVAARHRFLSAGHYAPIAARLGALAPCTGSAPALLDVGTGTGYYLAAMLEMITGSRGIGVDVSVAACRRASQAHPRLGAVVADVWQQLPVGDAQLDVVTSVFAPRNAAEFSRVLKPTGRLLVVHPQPRHLAELREPLGLLGIEDAKAERLDQALAGRFDLDHTETVEFESSWDAAALSDLVWMGPNAFHLDDAEVEPSLLRLRLPLTVTVAVTLSGWRPRRP